MLIKAHLPTSYGPRLVPARRTVCICVTPIELHTLIRAIERDAAQAERDGRVATADRLAHRAITLRDVMP